MISKFRQVVAVFSLVALGAVIAAAPAQAATPTGVGSAGGDTTLLGVNYGDFIQAALLAENNSDTIDPVNGTPTATESLSPLKVQSVAVPALDALTVTPVETSTTGAADEKSTALLDLSTLGVPGVTGSVNPATLSSLVDVNGAQSDLTSTLANVSLAGILGVDSASLQLGGVAGPSVSTTTRGVTANAISVLDLQALLNLLGLQVPSLPLNEIAGLLAQLDEIGAVNSLLGNTTFGSAADLTGAIGSLNAAIDSAQTTLTSALANLHVQQLALTACLANPLCGLVTSLLGAAQAAVTTAQAAVDAAQTAVDTLQAQLDALIQAMLDVLGGTPLIALDGVSAGAVATAKDTVDNSSAVVSATVNDVRVGGLDLGGVDANATLDQISALAATATNTLNGVLATIDPNLANLISIALFQRATDVAQVGDYVNAVAGITALKITITPPDICTVVRDVIGRAAAALPAGVTAPAAPVSALLTELGSGVPSCTLQTNSVRTAQPAVLGATDLPALTGPLTFRVAAVSSAASFKVVDTTVISQRPLLPRTGMNETLLLVIGGLMAAAALGLRRITVPEPAAVPIKK